MAGAELPARSHRRIAAALETLLAGCSAGPDFRPPAAPATDVYTATPLPSRTAASATMHGGGQHLAPGAEVSTAWWYELGSPRLNALVAQAFVANPTLAEAQATLRQAEETHAARTGSARYPQMGLNLDAQRQQQNPAVLGQAGNAGEFDLYNARVGVRYRLDLAGGNRRALEALAARADHQRYQLAAARLTLAANIASAAIRQAQLADQLDATQAIVQLQERQLALIRERVRLGTAAPDEVASLQTQLERTRAGVPLLRQRWQQYEHLLATLAGRPPGGIGLPTFRVAEFTLPAELPLVFPSELVRRRPDIQAAEALLRAANADYGVAIAKLYPQLDLGGSLGSQALSAGTLFGGGSTAWSLLAQLTQPLLDPGLPAQKRAALAALDAAAAHYQGVVLESLRDVADVLRAVDNDAQALSARANADTAARTSLLATDYRHALGAASEVQLLIAQQEAQQTRIELIAAQAQRLVDSVALYEAMGGGEDQGEAVVTPVRLADTPSRVQGHGARRTSASDVEQRAPVERP